MSNDIEQAYEWRDMTEQQKYLMVASLTAAFKAGGVKARQSRMERIFELGQPKCVIGIQDGKPFVRVDASSADVMKLLITEYLTP